MKAVRSTATASVLLLAAAGAAAEPGTIPMKFGRAPPSHRVAHFNGFIAFPFVEREVVRVYEREIIREVPVEAPAPPPAPREAYVIGRSYSSLPGGCMKMIEGGAAYFYCSGDWYRAVGSRYKAVAAPL